MAAEKDFENKVKDYLKSQGCWFVKFFANSFTRKGVPDILVCCKGYFVGVETKGAKGTPTPLQLYNRDEIRKAGGIAVILYPEQFESFKDLIEQVMNNRIAYAKAIQYGFDREWVK